MTLIYFIIILGTIIFIHELGHFIFAKKAGIYCYEFSLGMGPKIFSKKRKKKKDETEYCIRLIPLGGFVSMAGESVEVDTKVPKNRNMQDKTWWERFITIFAGPLFNFILSFILLFIIGTCFGSTSQETIVKSLLEGYPAINSELKVNDKIISINGKKVVFWDDIMMKLQLINNTDSVKFKVERNNKIITIDIKPKKEKIKGTKDVYSYKFGFSGTDKREYGLINGVEYASIKTFTLTKSMISVLGGLFTGKVGLNNLSGPVGIYGVVGSQAKAGFASVLYLIAFLSINVGFINLIPFPAFDGGRILFLIIEKIKGKPVSPKLENTMHNIGFFLLIGLMILVTFNDILRLFGG